MSPITTTAKLEPIKLVGQRVDLVPMETRHAEALFVAGADPEIFRFWKVPMTSAEDIREFIRVALANRDDLGDVPWVIFDKEQQKIVGSTRLFDVQLANRGAEIGHTWYSRSVWRTRVNSECKYLILRQCFEVWRLIRVQFKTDQRNMRSQDAIARLGAKKEGVLRNHVINSDGYIRSSVYFSVLAEEWPEVKKKLEGFLET